MINTCVIVQPCFFPWRGQFDLFYRGKYKVFLDDVQYVRRSWYNRNKIYLNNSIHWITVPVKTKGCYFGKINSIHIDNSFAWRRKIKNSLTTAYRRYPHFEEYATSLYSLLDEPWEMIAQLSAASMVWTAQALNMPCNFTYSSSLNIEAQDPLERLIAICHHVGADTYISGPSAKGYIGEGRKFRTAGITLEWMQYPQYPDYPLSRNASGEELSILDLIFCTGKQAKQYIFL